MFYMNRELSYREKAKQNIDHQSINKATREVKFSLVSITNTSCLPSYMT